MLRYLKLYSSFARICAMREMEARGSFFVGFLVITLFPLFPLLFIGAIYGQTNSLGGWSFHEYLVLTGLFQVLSAIVMTVCLRNLFGMPELIRKGELDFYLLKPINSQFLLSTRYLAYTELAQALPGTAMIVIGLVNLNGQVEWWRWLLLPIFMLTGLIILYSIWFIAVLPCIWLVRFESFELFFGLLELGRYHPTMFGGIIRLFLVFVLPLGVVAATPADLLLKRLSPEAGLWALIVAGILLYVSNRFWRFAQNHYYGASS